MLHFRRIDAEMAIARRLAKNAITPPKDSERGCGLTYLGAAPLAAAEHCSARQCEPVR